MLPHLSHYLCNNQPPSDENDAREMKALREKPLEELSTINVEIERIEAVLDSPRKRAKIQKYIDECNTILAPVQRPSLDVWTVIFTHCLVTHRNPIMGASEAPILLTRVCRDWRSIALTTPQIWSKLYIPLLDSFSLYRPDEPGDHIQKDKRRMEARSEEAQKWLRLSATCPLSISINPPYTSISHQPLLDAIIRSSRRWQQLELGYLLPTSDVFTVFPLLFLSFASSVSSFIFLSFFCGCCCRFSPKVPCLPPYFPSYIGPYSKCICSSSFFLAFFSFIHSLSFISFKNIVILSFLLFYVHFPLPLFFCRFLQFFIVQLFLFFILYFFMSAILFFCIPFFFPFITSTCCQFY